ncbi:STAS domain-containing protein [bacterium]|nr:STAS domain-containing protein [bacterium]
MKYEKENTEGIIIVRVQESQITMSEAPDVKTALLGLMVEEGDCILLNLRSVQKMDSTGMGALLFGIRQAEQHDKELCVCELNDKVRFLIRIARLEEVIDVFESEKEALAELKDEEGDA